VADEPVSGVYGPYRAKILDWHDGDTCHADLDLGFGIILAAYDLGGKPVLSCRIYGINAPELANPDGSGKAAHAYAEGLCPPGTLVTVMSHSWDKYGGRYDGEITLPDGRVFGDVMIENGMAVAYFGGTKTN